jgi:hypothetical protein
VEIQELKDARNDDICLMVRIRATEYQSFGEAIIKAAATRAADIIVELYIEKHGAELVKKLEEDINIQPHISNVVQRFSDRLQGIELTANEAKALIQLVRARIR